MKIKNSLFFILVLVFFSGCATRPISNSDAAFVPKERILDPQLLIPTPNSGIVIIKRDKGFGGSACSSRVFIDAKPIADLKVLEKIVIYLSPGEYVFSAWPNGICGGGMSEVRTLVKSGAEQSFRIGYGSNGDFTINATAF